MLQLFLRLMRQWFLISASDGRGEIEKQALLSPQFSRETAACPFVPGMCEEGNPSQHPSSKGQIFILLFLFYVHRPFPGNSTRILISMLLLLLSCFSCVQLLATPWTAAHQAPPSMGFSRQEYWSGCHCFLISIQCTILAMELSICLIFIYQETKRH